MKKININKNILFVFFILGFGLFGLINIFSSGGLIYSEIKNSIQVEIIADEESSREIANEVFNQSTQLSNVARVERSENTIIFQNTNFETVNNEISNTISGKENVSYVINEESPIFDSTNTINATFTLALIVITISSLGLLYIFSRPKEEIPFAITVKSVVLFLFNSLMHFIVFLSFIGILSRVYYVKAFDINILIISTIFSSFIYLLIVLTNKKVFIQNDFDAFRLKLRKESLKYLRMIFISAIALIFGLSIGLGANFVITGFVLLIGLISPLTMNIFSTNLYFISQPEIFEQFKNMKVSNDNDIKEGVKHVSSNQEKSSSKKNKKSWNKRFKKKKK